MSQITLRPVGEIDQKILEGLQPKLQETFGCPVQCKPGISKPRQAYDPQRRQYISPLFLAELRALGVEPGERVLGLVDVDLYAPGLNFVFGEADIGSRVAIIALSRLRQEYYGMPPDERLFRERVIKEAVHELGHTYGLGHCRDRKCVMYFSNTLSDTDHKQAAFCEECRHKIETRI